LKAEGMRCSINSLWRISGQPGDSRMWCDIYDPVVKYCTVGYRKYTARWGLLLLHSAARDCGIKPWRITVIIRIVSLAAQPIRLTITLPRRCSVILREANTWRLVERVDGDRSVSVCIISRKFRQSTSQSAINGVVSVSLHSGKKILTLFLKDCLSVDKKLICRKETARCFVSLNISLSHSRSLKMVPFESLDTVSYSNSL